MAMTIRSNFKITAPAAVVWPVLTDIERAAACFPGAVIKQRQEDGSYLGEFNVRLGPMRFKFAGTFGFIFKDEEAGTAQVYANGNDVKGRGGANAKVDIVLREQGGQTHVEVVSNVDLSGSVAQYGRGAGMIEALSQQLLNQFAENLQQMITSVQPSSEKLTETQRSSLNEAKTATHPTLNATSLFWRVFVQAIGRWWSALFNRSSKGRKL